MEPIRQISAPQAFANFLTLDQLGERILQAARDRNRAALHNVKVREFLGRELRRRIDGGARLAHDDIFHVAIQPFEQMRDKDLAFLGSRSVADGDNVHVVFLDQPFDGGGTALDILPRLDRIDDRRIHHLAGTVDHREFTADRKSVV